MMTWTLFALYGARIALCVVFFVLAMRIRRGAWYERRERIEKGLNGDESYILARDIRKYAVVARIFALFIAGTVYGFVRVSNGDVIPTFGLLVSASFFTWMAWDIGHVFIVMKRHEVRRLAKSAHEKHLAGLLP